MRATRSIVIAVLALAVAGASWADGASGQGVSARIHGAPTAVTATDGRRHLVYEVFVDNRSPSEVRLRRLEVRDPAEDRRLAAYRGPALADLVARGDGVLRTLALPAGTSAMLLLDVPLDPKAPVPGRLVHRCCSTPAEPCPSG